mgnify:CR=1 FL=1
MPSIAALWLATLIILAGYLLPDIRHILQNMHLLPLLGAIVFLAGMNLVTIETPAQVPDAAVVQSPAPSIQDAANTSREDQLMILGQLSRNIAHELSNVMQPALTYSQLLQGRFSEPDLQEALSGIINSQQQSARILQHFLQLSGVENFEKSELPLAHSIKHALESIRPLLPASLILQFGDLSRVRNNAIINPHQMAQLLALLMTTASRATQNRGMVAVHVRRGEGEMAELIVADNRSQPPVDDDALLPAYHIVQSWGGSLQMEYQPGKGATARISIPILSTG